MQNNNDNLPVSPEALERKHESQNPGLRWILLTGGVVTLMVLGCLVVVWNMMILLSKVRPAGKTAERLGVITAPSDELLRRFPAPNLQVIPREELLALERREERELSTYGWVNRTAGVARIPIDRAMELIAQRGLPRWTTNGPPQAGRSSMELIRERSEHR